MPLNVIIVFPTFRIGELLEVFCSLDEAEKAKERAEKKKEEEEDESERERSGSPAEGGEGGESSPPPSPTASDVTSINTVRRRYVCVCVYECVHVFVCT